MSDTEREMVGRLKKGDPTAWHWLVDRYGNRLFGLARSLVGKSEDAEDVVQETFTGAFRSMRGFEGRASLWTWLVRILVRQAGKQRRTGPVVLRLDSDEGTVPGDDSTRAIDAKVDLAGAMAMLSQEYREVLLLRESEQMSYEEISQALGIPLGTVESRLYRARAELRKWLVDWKG